ncbi:flagellar FlbD family protein [Geodermatophilus sp. SYSU D00742]
MIGLTRRTGEQCRLDPDHIERVEARPDTVVHLTDGARYCVLETIDQIVARIREDRAGVIAACYVLDRGEDADPLGLGRTPVAPEVHGPAPAIPLRWS